MHISVHALLRYIQRTYHLDIEKIRSEIACRARLGNKRVNFTLQVTDGELVKFIEKNHPRVIENSRADLQYYTTDRFETFIRDNMKFVVRDSTLITVFDV